MTAGLTVRFFFYGTLMDDDVCRAVLGERCRQMRVEPAVLPGYRRVRAARGDFPVLTRRTGRRLDGQLVRNLPGDALLAIAHYEGPDYAPRRAMVIDQNGERHSAWIFMPRHGRIASSRPWDFDRWQKHGKPRLRPRLERWMLEFGALTLQSIDTPWHVKRQILALRGEQGETVSALPAP